MARRQQQERGAQGNDGRRQNKKTKNPCVVDEGGGRAYV
jgi:hypothetical protein